MKINNVYILIEKYFDGTTTLAEEESLRSFYSEPPENLPEDLKAYARLFTAHSEYHKEHLDEAFTEQLWQKIEQEEARPQFIIFQPWFKRLTVAAASLIIMFSVYSSWFSVERDRPFIAVHDDKEMTEKEALLATKQALAFVSMKLNKGRKPMKNLGAFYQVQSVVKKR